jgi:hypothetical protein
MSERGEDQELTELASVLRELHPQREMLDHAVLMYRAGRASVHSWVLPLTTMLSVSVALVLTVTSWFRPAPAVVERTVYVTAPGQAAPARPDGESPTQEVPSRPQEVARGAWSSYVHLQEKVIADGLDGLPELPNTPEPAPNLESLLRSY